MKIFFVIFISNIIINLVYLVSIAFTCWIAGVKIETIGLFVGPRLKQFNYNGVCLQIRLLPIGSSIKMNFPEFDDLKSDIFSTFYLLRRTIIHISGYLGMLLLSIICVGYDETLHGFCSGFNQIIQSIFSPLSKAQNIISTSFNFIEANTITVSFGVFLSKFAAWNLLPVPTLAGGYVVLNFFIWLIGLRGYRPTLKLQEGIATVGNFILILAFFSGMLALVFYFLHR